MEITRTVINREGNHVVGNTNYGVACVILDGTLNSLSVVVSEGVTDKDSPNYPGIIQIGYIRKENGRLTVDFQSDTDPTPHLMEFMKIVEEIEFDLV